MSITIKAFSNDDCAYIVWGITQKIENCIGFALFRKFENKDKEILNNHVGFSDDFSAPGMTKPSTIWPIQELEWFDFEVKPGEKVQYQVVPIRGTKDNPIPADELASSWTDLIKIGNEKNNTISAYFNRGTVMSQWISRRVGDAEGEKRIMKIKDILLDVDDKTRKFLAGEIREQLLLLLEEVKQANGFIYAALFELNDPELINALGALGPNANLILANGSTSRAGEDENRVAREYLRAHGVQVHDRMLPSGHLAHNKFLVMCNRQRTPVKVWTGSANWTTTGLCTQANNCVLIHNEQVANYYLEQWSRLVECGNNQPEALKAENSKVKTQQDNDRKISVFFAPVHNPDDPSNGYVDLNYAANFINNAKEGILFLMFNPGSLGRGTLLDTIINKSQQSKIYVRGIVNQNLKDANDPSHDLIHLNRIGSSMNLEIILPDGIQKSFAFWDSEVTHNQFTAPGGIGHAIIHSKVVLIDPFGDHPVVITGSHNMGPKASEANDENLIMIENDHSLAEQYAVNIISLFHHYHWRFKLNQGSQLKSWSGLVNGDSWQDPYFDDKSGETKERYLLERRFWLEGTETVH